jgi:hypothetical protein
MAISDATGLQYKTSEDFFDHILRHDYKEVVAETVITPNYLLQNIKATDRRTSGQDVVFPIHISRNQGYSAIKPYGALPDPGAQGYSQYAFKVRHMYQRCKFDGASKDASAGSAAWLAAVDSEIKGAARDLSRQRQRAMWNDGSGRLCEVASGSSGTTITCEHHAGVFFKGVSSGMNMSPVKHIRVGMRVAFVTPNGTIGGAGTHVATRTVTAVDQSAGTFTVNSSVSVSDGDGVCLASNTTSTSVDDTTFQNEPMGILGIVYDGNPEHDSYFQGVDASSSTNDWHRANILSNAGTSRAITELLMDEAYQRTQEIAGVDPSCIIGDFAMLRAVGDFLKEDRRFVAGTDSGSKTYGGGHAGVSWNGTPIVADRDAWSNALFFVDKSDLTIDYMAKPGWMDMDGSMYSRVTDQDAYEATLYCRDTLSSDVRDHHTILTDLA